VSWIDRYYSRTRPPFAELTRFFFLGLFNPESTAGEDSFSTWLVQVLAVLIAASWFLPVQLFRRYVELHALPEALPYQLGYSSDCLSMLVFMTLLMGVVTVLEWPSLFPSRRDNLVLTPLPVTRSQLFGAKLAALILFVTLFVAALTLLSSAALPAIASGRWEARPLGLRAAALLVAAIGSCYFIFLALLAVQGVLMAILPVRWFEPASFAVQVMLLIAILCGFPLFPHFPARRLVAAQSPWLDWIPPAWFWGLAEWMQGKSGPVIERLAAKAAIGLSVALAVAAAAYLVSYLQYSRFSLEAQRRDRAPVVGWAALFGRFDRTPQARAVGEFVIWTFSRGRRQKLAFLLILAIGLALIFENSVYLSLRIDRLGMRAASASIENAAIALPLTLSFFAMIGVRRAFRVPGDLDASWLFRFAEDARMRSPQLDAVRRSLIWVGGAPVLLLCAPIEFGAIGGKAVWVLLMQWLLTLTLAEYLLQAWRAIPFTFAPNPARRHFIHSAILHVFELSVYSFMSATWIYAGLRDSIMFAGFGAVVLAVYVWLRYRRRREWGIAPFEFEESVPAAVEPIRIAQDC
jgi:hypothetical protein